MQAAVTRLLTVDDLAERWGLTPASVLTLVKTRAVPYLTIKAKRGSLEGRGPKLLRFRADSIDQWEREQESIWDRPSITFASCDRKGMIALGWDGKER